MNFKQQTRKLLNSALSRIDLEIVRKHNGVRRWFDDPRPVGSAVHTAALGPAERDGVPFGIVVPTVYGPVIVNRHDINQTNALIKTGKAYNHAEIGILCGLLQSVPDRPVVLDIGANVGLYSLEFARAVRSRGGVCHAFEAQRVFAGMIGGTAALNGALNLHVHHLAIGDRPELIPIPGFDYDRELNFGSVEFGGQQREVLSQDRNDRGDPEMVKQVSIDSLAFSNVVLMKIDVEGMELQALRGAAATLERDLPVLCVEWIKSDKMALVQLCSEFGYVAFAWGSDLLFVHASMVERYPSLSSFERLN